MFVQYYVLSSGTRYAKGDEVADGSLPAKGESVTLSVLETPTQFTVMTEPIEDSVQHKVWMVLVEPSDQVAEERICGEIASDINWSQV